jgi:transposase
MIDQETRKAIYRLHERGMGMRKIARSLGISRNTAREIIKAKGEMPESTRQKKETVDPELLEKLHKECDGYRSRMHEILTEEGVGEEKKTHHLPYSTLTRMLRKLGIGNSRDDRCDRVPDEPGQEMQHDTTTYRVRLGSTSTKLVASILYLRYSKRRYLKFYRSFRRFHMKCFLHEALTFWRYVAAICIIDNTNLARLRGTGKDAVIVPEMEAFAKKYGFRFECHALKKPNRKAGCERGFYTVETNFFPGRRFESLEDLNNQAFEWATVKREQKPVGKSRLIPAVAFEHEKSYLKKLEVLPTAPYLLLERTIDQYGYVAVDSNYYWVPGKGRGKVKVFLFSDRHKIYRSNRELLSEYPLAPDGVKNECFSPKGYPKPRYKPKNRRKPTAEEEKRLRALGEVAQRYLDFALKEQGPRKRHRFLRELFRLSRHMTQASFLAAVERALKYRITRVETIRHIALLNLAEGTEMIPSVEVDESFRKREAYLDGHLSEEPDLSIYDDLFEEEEEEEEDQGAG